MPGPKFRFVHTADLHLDTPFATIGRVAPQIAARLRDASLEAFDAMIGMAIEQEAAFVVFAGDIYNSADRGVRAQLRFLRGIERLGEHRILAYVAHGNHDPMDGWSAVRRFPENLVVFGSDAVEAHTLGQGDTPWAHLYGISYPSRDVRENLALRFQRRDAPGLHIGVLHCNVGGQPDHAAYSPCTVPDLTAAGMDYWALGHVHEYQLLATGHPWIVYPGSPQAIKSNELGPKGAVMVEVADDRVTDVELIPLDRVRFARIDVDIAGESDLRSLQKTILERAVSDGTDLLMTVTLSGRGPLHRDLRHAGALDDLLRDVREEFGVASPFIWVDRIIDQTRAELEREAIARRGDFSADLVRMAATLRSNRSGLESLLATLWSAASRIPADDADPLLLEAEQKALDLLEGEQLR
jgi:DNA repair exonuclease SbcCD nuclease subunit